jgi:ethanolamine permease
MSSMNPEPSPALNRTLGPVMIWGLGVGYVISGSYFGWNYGLEEGGPWGMLLALVVATALYVTFVLGYAELACAIPRSGGAFAYARRAFGRDIAFLTGFAQIVEYTLAPPAIAFSIGSYMQTGFGLNAAVVAVVAYVVFTAVNIAGVHLSAGFELVITVLAVVELFVFGAVALPSFSWTTFSIDALPHGWGGAFFALPFALWFYLAIEGIANVAEEAKDPQRDLPRGFLSAMATLVVLAHLALFGAVGVAGWRAVLFENGVDGAQSDSPLPLAIRHVVGADHPLFTILTGVGLLGLIASFHGILLASSRALLAMGRARFLPSTLAKLHPTRRTPAVALVVNFVVGLLALATGRTGDIILVSIFGALTLYLVSTLALFRLRAREPQLPRPYKTPGYPVVPAVALVLTVVALLSMVVTRPLLGAVYVAVLAIAWGLWRAFGGTAGDVDFNEDSDVAPADGQTPTTTKP